MDRAAIDEQAGADAGADREVADAVDPGGRTPAMLADRGGGDVGVEVDGNAEPVAEHRRHRRMRPPGLGRAGDVSPGVRARVEIDRAK
jgi:hypothetical protein